MGASDVRVILSAAASIDGRIATKAGESRMSSDRDIARLHGLRGRVDAILVGKNTVLKDDPLLTARQAGSRNPARVVLDSKGVTPDASRLLRTCNQAATIIAVSEGASAYNRRRLQSHGADIITAGKDRVDVRLLLIHLAERGIRTILVEGGGRTNWEFVRLGLFDEVILTVSPYVVGGDGAVPLVSGEGFGRISDSPKLRLASFRRMGDHLVVRYVRDEPHKD